MVKNDDLPTMQPNMVGLLILFLRNTVLHVTQVSRVEARGCGVEVPRKSPPPRPPSPPSVEYRDKNIHVEVEKIVHIDRPVEVEKVAYRDVERPVVVYRDKLWKWKKSFMLSRLYSGSVKALLRVHLRELDITLEHHNSMHACAMLDYMFESMHAHTHNIRALACTHIHTSDPPTTPPTIPHCYDEKVPVYT